MLRTLTALPSLLLRLMILMMISRCSTALVDYTDGSSVSDEFARWILSHIAHERDIEVQPLTA